MIVGSVLDNMFKVADATAVYIALVATVGVERLGPAVVEANIPAHVLGRFPQEWIVADYEHNSRTRHWVVDHFPKKVRHW